MTPETRTRLVQLINDVHFTPVRLRDGYDMRDVDTFLDRLAAEISADRPVADLVRRAGFTPVRVREGYDMGEVDELLDQIVSAAGSPPVDAPQVELAGPMQQLAAELSRHRFTTVHVKPGYDMHQVDELLDRVVAAVSAGQPLGAVLFGTELDVVRFRSAYDRDEVDALLARLRQY